MAQVKYKEISPELESLAEPKEEQFSRSSVGMEGSVGEFYYISVDNLIPYKKQARQNFDDEEIKNLSNTIKEHGIRQPLTIMKSSDGKFEIVSGERRFRAAKLSGIKKVPCIIIEGEDEAEEIALVENIQRKDLHPIEIANACQSLLTQYEHGDQKKLSLKLGLSKSKVSELLSFAALPDEIKTHLLEKNIFQREKLREITKCTSLEEMKKKLGLLGGELKLNKKKHIANLYLDESGVKLEVKRTKFDASMKKDIQKILDNFIKTL